MTRITSTALLTLVLLAGCSGLTGARAVVEGAGQDELLKLRGGPGLGFRVILGLPDGTELIRRDCVTEIGQLWCRVSLRDAPQITGYVSADYLSVP
ncbi:SH3 domain-containing protein [Ponticoccus sp. SC2-23]|uniref:SH3 domain-containing protein n=1 Tax=Alexandriicola marinus TaxID=2081710 RepID=UPI000FD7ED23|nr:SH3 domain-containing protein [Alexandriicola marinus]MBM1220989.1 SH3 domain-containing protein [Ponticoccus sp. SC6-9]MBM1225559.1 SH3 domain-containing protein [Ponticoccus sp. SC6-15]MBM1231878.1 SH3 domain-containing protein [Ponticoccus sp. SC6-38]MBM1236401.1 SH3 domain-containing protein [Ponticoccus sp. SC6-45]MBM1240900.1 SH3 domain-containing protein [Ponticoccus sp. SC6-49]MBM1243482.1 SH3 domain-containing protein [Ponticoccus sp. SC2-64]MBM1249901.1 SH3 domain-containing pro